MQRDIVMLKTIMTRDNVNLIFYSFQVQIFRMYLSLALSPRRTLNGRLCVWACGRCGEAAAAPPHVAAAARAAAAQALRAYCAQLGKET